MFSLFSATVFVVVLRENFTLWPFISTMQWFSQNGFILRKGIGGTVVEVSEAILSAQPFGEAMMFTAEHSISVRTGIQPHPHHSGAHGFEHVTGYLWSLMLVT